MIKLHKKKVPSNDSLRLEAVFFKFEKWTKSLISPNHDNDKIFKSGEIGGQNLMNKAEIIARRIFGWKLNRWDRWYDFENNIFIPVSEFQPEQNIDHAMLIVKKLEEHGFTYKTNGDCEVCFTEVCAAGGTLAQAITNAASDIADNSSIADEWL